MAYAAPPQSSFADPQLIISGLNGPGPSAAYGSTLVADFNNDGKPDVATVGSTNISILLGNGNGGFSSPILSPWASSQYATPSGTATVADYNHDGILDIAALNTGGALWVALGNGDGSFTNFKTLIFVGGSTYSSANGDFNHDGREDVAFVSSNFQTSANTLVIDCGTTSSTVLFQCYTISLPTGDDTRSIAVGDMNNDGRADIIIGGWANAGASRFVTIYFNDGTGRFPTHTRYSVPNSVGVEEIALTDFNGDGYLDVASVGASSQAEEQNLSILLGSSGGVLSNPISYPVGNVIQHLTTGDFNGDGSTDIAVVDEDTVSTHAVSILDNNGSGVFNSVKTFSLSSNMGPITSGDLNNDGKSDLVVNAYGATPPAVALFFNSTQPDSIPPSVIGIPDRSPNSAGWYNNDVNIDWQATDSAPSSGTPTDPPDTLATLEGTNTYTSAPSCDPAGNCATGSLTLSIDKIAPSINYSIAPAANNYGWRNSDTTVSFTCDDSISGIASCSDPVTLSSEGANQTVTGTATDNAGNSASVTATVNIDKTAPTIGYSLSPSANSNGWNNSDVTVTYTCSDSLSGVATCSSPITLTGEGANQIVEGTATDKADNTASAAALVSIDRTAPVVSTLSWSVNPVQQGQNTTLLASASDSLSGVASLSYSINGGTPQPMFYDPISGQWIVTFGSSLGANTYNITVYATDNAGNTSAGTNDILVVYTTANGYVTGHAKIQPTASDTMPIALDTSRNPTNLVLGFTNVTAPMSGSFDMDYSIKNNQNEFSLSSTSLDWVVVSDSTHASILGQADMTKYVNGVQTITQNMSVRFDIVLGSNGASDQVTIKIFNPSDNPNTATPAYLINEPVQANGSNLMIHP